MLLLAGLGAEGEAGHFDYFIFGGRPPVFFFDTVASLGISASLPRAIFGNSNAILKGMVLKDIQNVLDRFHFLSFFPCVKRRFEKMSPLLGVHIVVEIKQILLDLTDQIDLVFQLKQFLILEEFLYLFMLFVNFGQFKGHGDGFLPEE